MFTFVFFWEIDNGLSFHFTIYLAIFNIFQNYVILAKVTATRVFSREKLYKQLAGQFGKINCVEKVVSTKRSLYI